MGGYIDVVGVPVNLYTQIENGIIDVIVLESLTSPTRRKNISNQIDAQIWNTNTVRLYNTGGAATNGLDIQIRAFINFP